MNFAQALSPKDMTPIGNAITDSFRAMDGTDPDAKLTATQTLISQIDTLESAAAKTSQRLKDVVDMFVIEAARKPLGALREDQPDKGFRRGVMDSEFQSLANSAESYRTEKQIEVEDE